MVEGNTDGRAVRSPLGGRTGQRSVFVCLITSQILNANLDEWQICRLHQWLPAFIAGFFSEKNSVFSCKQNPVRQISCEKC